MPVSTSAACTACGRASSAYITSSVVAVDSVNFSAMPGASYHAPLALSESVSGLSAAGRTYGAAHM